jgi:histidyl-tRNA synthetase
MFRYDRPQEGRYRQFSSVGVECIGERSPFLDVEVIEMGWGFFAALGLTGISLQVNTLGDSDDRRRYREMLVSYFSPIANMLCEDCQRRLSINPLRLLDCKRDAQAVASAPSALDAVSSASRDYFDTVLRGLQYEAIPVHINPRLVRGLDYYAHTAFEFWHASLQGAQNALGGGGRYDGLSELIGREPVAGTGYGLGVDRILQAAHRQGVAPQPRPQCDAVVAPVTAAEVPVAAELARRLRQAGVRTSLDPAERKLDRKVRDAGRSGAHALVIVGPEEVESRTLKVRDLSARTQTSAPQEDVVSAVEAILARSVSSGDRAAAR